MKKSLAKEKGKLEAEVERLKIEVSEAKHLGITEFKESEAYKSLLTSTVVMFLAKEKTKIEKLLQMHYNNEDLSCLAQVVDEPTFFWVNDDEVGEEVTQSDP